MNLYLKSTSISLMLNLELKKILANYAHKIDLWLTMYSKNIFLFYLLLLIPIGIIVLSAKYGYISSNLFVILLFSYVFLYHPFICGIRLVQSNKISKQHFWKTFIPLWNDKHWTFLFFNR